MKSDNCHKCLVTGADGFIGSHLVEALIASGKKVRALSFYNSFGFTGWLGSLPKEYNQSVEVVSGDIRDSNFVREIVRDVDCVFHLAALIGIPYSYVAPQSYYDTNVLGTLNILQAARDFQCQKIICTSTSEVYGTAQFVPISEAHPLVGQSPYSASKIAADQLAYSYFCSFETPVSIIRPFNTYGPRQSLRAVIPTIIEQAISGSKEISLGEINSTRDFNFVSDTVAGFMKALEATNIAGETINLCSNYEVSIEEVVNIISQCLNRKIIIRNDKRRIRPEKSEVYRLFGDNAKAKDILGWTPKFSGLDGLQKGLMQTIDWMKSEPSVNAKDATQYRI